MLDADLYSKQKALISVFIIALLMLLLSFILSGCTYNVDNEKYSVNGEIFGTITDKFMAPHQDIVEYKMIDGENTKIEKHTVDRYYFEIERKDKDDKFVTDIEVSKEVFDKYGIGDFYGE